MVARVLETTGSTVRARGAMYKAVDQSVLLYSIKSWVVTGDMLKVLEGFHHQASRHITGRGEWEYPSVVEAMETAVLHPIGVYIRRLQATTAERVACRPIYELCTEKEWIPGTIRLV